MAELAYAEIFAKARASAKTDGEFTRAILAALFGESQYTADLAGIAEFHLSHVYTAERIKGQIEGALFYAFTHGFHAVLEMQPVDYYDWANAPKTPMY